jgi:hypothetical protein
MAQIFVFGLLACLPFILTYFLTAVECKVAQQSKKFGKKAPLVPYAVPILCHALMFFWSPYSLFQNNRYIPLSFLL